MNIHHSELEQIVLEITCGVKKLSQKKKSKLSQRKLPRVAKVMGVSQCAWGYKGGIEISILYIKEMAQHNSVVANFSTLCNYQGIF